VPVKLDYGAEGIPLKHAERLSQDQRLFEELFHRVQISVNNMIGDTWARKQRGARQAGRARVPKLPSLSGSQNLSAGRRKEGNFILV